MFGVILFCLAAATALPYNDRGIGPKSYQLEKYNEELTHPLLDEKSFETRRVMSKETSETHGLDDTLANWNKLGFPALDNSSQGIEGEEYIVNIPLKGFEQKDIVVNANNGRLTVHAVHELDGIVMNKFLNERTLPNYVNGNSSWSYTEGVLKIVFSLKSKDTTNVVSVLHDTKPPTSTETVVIKEPTTESRKELDNHVTNDARVAEVDKVIQTD